MKKITWGCCAFVIFCIACATTKQSPDTAGVIRNPLLNSPIHAIIAGADNVIYAATEDSGMVRSTDMGGHWEKFSNGMGTTPYISALAMNSRGDIFAATIGSGIYQLPSGAQAWQRADTTLGNNGLLRVPSLVISPVDNSIYAATVDGGVYESPDNGANWRLYNEELGILNINTIAITDKNILYLRCVGGGVFRRGASEPTSVWKAVNQGIEDPYVTGIGAQHNGTVFVGTRNGKAYKMGDDEYHWQDASAGLPQTIINCFGSAAWGTEVAGTKQGLYRYDQQSGTWIPFTGAAQTADIQSICILLDGTAFAGTENSGIIKLAIPHP